MLRNLGRAATTEFCKTVQNMKPHDVAWKMSYLDTTKNDAAMSPWHDIPLLTKAGEARFNYVNEIPQATRAKMEIATKVENNPIMQDIKKGKLRYFTYGDIPFNYGCLPCTWEDPTIKVADCGNAGGDNDPIDVCDLGKAQAMGSVYSVKVLGALAMIDEGETDWKIIVLPDTPQYEAFNTLKDLRDSPTYNAKLAEVLHWFRYYKTTDGKPENVFGFNSEFQDESYAMKVVEEGFNQYTDLITGKAENPKNLWHKNL